MQTKHYRFKRRFFIILGIFIVCTIAFIALMVSCTDTKSDEEKKAEEIPVQKASLVAFGDDLFHDTVYQAYESDGYDFTPIYEHVQDEIDKADIACINQETMPVKSNYSGYPLFGTPIQIIDTLHDVGFDVVLQASNHSADRGSDAIETMLKYWKEKYPKVKVLGAHRTEEDANKIKVLKKNGMTFALLNYTYDLNGLSLPAGKEYMIDMLDQEHKEKIKEDIKKASKYDFTIVFPHWGIEYQYEPVDEQKEWAQFFADQGVDVVIGMHPHVIEPVRVVKGKNGNRMVCFYSLGNFVSCQNEVDTMLGGMAMVDFVKDKDGPRVTHYRMRGTVTHIGSGFSHFTTYKLADYTEELASQNYIRSLASSEFSLKVLKNLFKEITGGKSSGTLKLQKPEPGTEDGDEEEDDAA
ncbi:MAG: CapA family protein [Bacillota bacterium]|nr:CapA family protein [Bacillota bacterium]